MSQVQVHVADGVTGLVARPEGTLTWWRVVGWTGLAGASAPLVRWAGESQPFPRGGVIEVTYEPTYWRAAR